jgi:quinone-modifying oxidoreductase subunit QmoB
MVSLKQAKYVREDYDDGKAFVFYQHMRTPGFQENFLQGHAAGSGHFHDQGRRDGRGQKR